jgi:hypothetical protein
MYMKGVKMKTGTKLYDLLSYCSQSNLLNRSKNCRTSSFTGENIISVKKTLGKQPLQRL